MSNQELPVGLKLVREAEQAVRQGNTAEALALLKRAEALAPGNVTVHLYKSLASRAISGTDEGYGDLIWALVNTREFIFIK